MSKALMIRVFVNQRLTAAAEEIFGLFERTIADYEEQLCRSKEENQRQQKLLDDVLSPQLRLHRAVFPADVHQLSVRKEKGLPEQQEWSPALIHEDTEHLQETLEGLREANAAKFPYRPLPVKSEDDEEQPQSSRFHQAQAERMDRGANGEHFERPQQTRNFDQEGLLPPLFEVKSEDFSKPVTEFGGESWSDAREHQSALNFNMINERMGNCKSLSAGSSAKPYVCPVCGKRLGYSGHLTTHMRTHTGEKPFSCAICGKRFTQKCSLTQHMVLHTGEKPFSCRICHERFAWRSQIRRHDCTRGQVTELLLNPMEERRVEEAGADKEEGGVPDQARNSDQEMHPEIEVRIEDYSEPENDDGDGDWKETQEEQSGECSPNEDEVAVNSKPQKAVKKPFSCPECNKRFLRKKSLKKHMRSHSGEKPFSCSVCDKRFSHKETLVRHSKFHSEEKPYKCSICGKNFSRKENFARHMRFHSGEKPFSCSFCNKHFSRQDHAVIHMRTHTGEKPYSCSVCGKKMNCRTSLRVHMRIHTGERPFSCTLCCKKFTQSGSLSEHMALHTGEKSYNCTECGKKVGSKWSLKVHMRMHTGERPFRCSVCGKGYTQKGNFMEHMAGHSGEKPFSCSVCDKKFAKQSQLKGHKCVSGGAAKAQEQQSDKTTETETSQDDVSTTSVQA